MRSIGAADPVTVMTLLRGGHYGAAFCDERLLAFSQTKGAQGSTARCESPAQVS